MSIVGEYRIYNWKRFQNTALVSTMGETEPEPEAGDPMTTPPKRRPTLDEVAAHTRALAAASTLPVSVDLSVDRPRSLPALRTASM